MVTQLQRRRRLADLPLVGYVIAPWSLLSEVRAALLQHGQRIKFLEARMTAMDNSLTEAARLVGLARAEFASLREQLQAEQTDDQAQVDAAVKQARDADAARLDQVLASLAEALPAPVPDVPTPAPGEPATDPESGQTTDEVLADTGGAQ